MFGGSEIEVSNGKIYGYYYHCSLHGRGKAAKNGEGLGEFIA